ncbi:MAG: PAS domain-containing protein [Rhodocyclaceae bacterium]|nr:PAS domain-containing protein [Rhodocyclaceae bacterium]
MSGNPISPTNVERSLREGEYIISTTDLAGRITAANPVFIEYSGYTEEQVLGGRLKNARHPDMPRSVFWLAWETVKGGEDFHGYIKNPSRDGSHYWAHAHITPILDAEGLLAGFRSLRRKPKPAAVAAVAPLYRRMLEAELAAGPQLAIAAGLSVLRAELAARKLSYEELMASF